MGRSGGSHYHFPRVTGLRHFYIIFLNGNFFGTRVVPGGVCPSLALGISEAHGFKITFLAGLGLLGEINRPEH
jgi:hypothetical protein